VHQTTLRFPEDLWRFLEQEAKSMGISVAQYVREAALARAAYDAGRRGDLPFVDPALIRGKAGIAPEAVPKPLSSPTDTVFEAVETVRDSSAVWAQARLVRRRSEQLRAQARENHDRTRAT
jgi:hypothetical protein